MTINILEYLEHTVRRVPGKTAFSGEDGGLTFRELYDQARAVGSRLLRDGVCKKPVAVFMKKQPKTVVAFLGVICAGCYYVPLDNEMPRHRIETILQNLGPAPVICDETTIGYAQEITGRGEIYSYDNISAGEADEGALAEVRRRQIDTDPIYIVFTSGSTGVPKGVVGCHRSVIDYIENLCPVLEFDENTVFGNQTPLYFDACLKEIIPTLKFGGTTVLIPKKLFLFPVKLVEYLNENRVNTLCWVVSALTFLSSLGTFGKVKPAYLRTVAFASEVFPIRQLNIWRSAVPDARFINLYGPTETTGICCYYRVERGFSEEETLPIGQPFPNTEILLLDGENRVPAPGEQGEICIRGSRLTLGYYRDPERTGEAFVQNPLNNLYPEKIYRTGDIGRYNDRGELLFLGRKDSQIKHMGHRIELGEIEAAANSCGGISTACCIYEGGKLIVYYVGGASAPELAAYLKEKLPRYMLPHTVKQIKTMPTTPNGKLDRNRLKTQWNS